MSVFKVIWQFKSNVVQSLSCFWLFVTPMESSTPGFPVLQCLLEFARIHVHWVMDAIQASHPLLLRSPPVLSLSQHQGLFQWVGSSHQVTKVSELQLQHQSFQWIFRVDFFFFFFFRIDWFDFLAVQGTLKSLPQHHSSKTSVLWCSAFFMVQLKMATHPVLLPWKSHGQRSLVGYSPCSHKELDKTEWPHFLSFSYPYTTTGKTTDLCWQSNVSAF